jgi:hypothetical protein
MRLLASRSTRRCQGQHVPGAIHTAIHNSVARDVLPMRYSAVRALPVESACIPLTVTVEVAADLQGVRLAHYRCFFTVPTNDGLPERAQNQTLPALAFRLSSPKSARAQVRITANLVHQIQAGSQAHRPLRFVWRNNFDPWAASNFREDP